MGAGAGGFDIWILMCEVLERRPGKREKTLTGAKARRPCEALHLVPRETGLCRRYTRCLRPM
jgi:hypothetical protein